MVTLVHSHRTVFKISGKGERTGCELNAPVEFRTGICKTNYSFNEFSSINVSGSKTHQRRLLTFKFCGVGPAIDILRLSRSSRIDTQSLGSSIGCIPVKIVRIQIRVPDRTVLIPAVEIHIRYCPLSLCGERK